MTDIAVERGDNGRERGIYMCPICDDVRQLREKINSLDQITTRISGKLEDTANRMDALTELLGERIKALGRNRRRIKAGKRG